MSEKLYGLEDALEKVLSRGDAVNLQLDKLQNDLRSWRRQSKLDARLLAMTGLVLATRAAVAKTGLPRFLPALALPLPLVFLALVFGGWAFAIATTMLLAGVSAAMFYYPSDSVISHWNQAKESSLNSSRAEIERIDQSIVEKNKLLAELGKQSEDYSSQINVIRSSQEHRSRQLFEQRWKEMRGDQFEKFLAEVFLSLDYDVQETGKSGDQGVDLIVHRGGRSIAIQAKGYVDSVSNAAVQQAYTGRKVHGCRGCAVITNSRFTSSAVEAAEKTGCVLVHEDNFEDFVFGRITFA